MTQTQAVINTMEQHGGYSTLGNLYATVPVQDWQTKTPFATIRRIVQDPRYFFKIRPGLWALKGWEKKIPADILAQAKVKPNAEPESNHYYYQGLLLEIGKLKHFETFVPHQDKNRKFLNQPLSTIATLGDIYHFTYDTLLQRAQTIDVSWFNERKMPNAFFEVEHSTDIYNSLLKFVDLQDFNVDFKIVAAPARKREFDSKLSQSAFKPIAERVGFISYDKLSDWHTKAYEISIIESTL